MLEKDDICFTALHILNVDRITTHPCMFYALCYSAGKLWGHSILLLSLDLWICDLVLLVRRTEKTSQMIDFIVMQNSWKDFANKIRKIWNLKCSILANFDRV